MENYVTWQQLFELVKLLIDTASLIFMIYYYQKKK